MAGLVSAVFAELFEKSVPAALALGGVLVGIWMYSSGCPVIFAVATAGALSLICLAIGRAILWRLPRTGRIFIEAWIVSPLAVAACLSALATFALLKLNVSEFLKPYVDPHNVDPKKLDDVATMIKGAVSGFFAIVLTKDIWEGHGPFSVATQFEKAVRDASASFNPTLEAFRKLTPDQKAAFPAKTRIDRMLDVLGNADCPFDNINGWGFLARGKRAGVIAACKPDQAFMDSIAAAGTPPPKP
jgi:hypothetical protein